MYVALYLCIGCMSDVTYMCEFSREEVVEYLDKDAKAVNEDDHLKKQPPHIPRCQSYGPDVLLGKLYL